MSKQKVRLTLIDGPTLLIEIGGLRILTDPTFDEPQVYNAGHLRIEKFNSPAVPADSLLPIHAVLLSHDQHPDNLDAGGRAFLPKAETVISTLGAAQRLGGKAQGLATWSSLTLSLPDGRALKVTATPARHGPIGFERNMGQVSGFVLSIGDSPSVYLSGDTVWYSEIAEIARRFDVGLAVLFAGSAQPRGPFNVTMNTNDALEAAAVFGNAKIVSVHNLGWSHYTQSPQDLAEAFDAVGLGERFQQLVPGVAIDFEV
jgi:L-ascorbate metabolism protein UlaG (beta-lactamase superfamily)